MAHRSVLTRAALVVGFAHAPKRNHTPNRSNFELQLNFLLARKGTNDVFAKVLSENQSVVTLT